MNRPCDGQTDGQTDIQTDRRNCDSICALTAYAVARKNATQRKNTSQTCPRIQAKRRECNVNSCSGWRDHSRCEAVRETGRYH